MNSLALAGAHDFLGGPDREAVGLGALRRTRAKDQKELSPRQRAFLIATILRKAHGIEAPYLYTVNESWDQHVGNDNYEFMSTDSQVIKAAVENGLLEMLGETNCVEELGVGTNSSTRTKTDVLLETLEFRYGHDAIATIVGYDGVERYVEDFMRHTFNKYEGVMTVTGGVADFMKDINLGVSDTSFKTDVDSAVNSGAKRVTLVWGGTLENGPDIIDGANPEHNLISYLAKINMRNGVGSVLLRTVDLDRDHESIRSSYEMTPEFSAFTLSSLQAAAGVDRTILLPLAMGSEEYVANHWGAELDVKDMADGWTQGRLLRVCKKPHNMRTIIAPDGVGMEEGTKVCSLITNKFSIERQLRAARLAGYGRAQIFDLQGNVYSESDIKNGAQPQSSKVLIASQSTSVPDSRALHCAYGTPQFG